MCGEHVLGRHLTLVLLVVTRLFRQDLEIEAALLEPVQESFAPVRSDEFIGCRTGQDQHLDAGPPHVLEAFRRDLADSRPMVRLSDCTLVVPVPGTLVSM